MRVALVGATGFIGIPLCEELESKGHEVVVLTRNVESAKRKMGDLFTFVQWDSSSAFPVDIANDVDAIVNLAGESIGDGRWSKDRKERVLNSRLKTTNKIVNAIGISKARSLPTDSAGIKSGHQEPCNIRTLINASAIGYYGPRDDDEKLCEDASPGNDFLASVCNAWEDEAVKAEQHGVRVVRIRTGIVLGDGGALKKMLLPFKLFTGGPIGSGRQWMSWIHKDDEIGIMIHALENENISGAINATAPEPLTMRDFSKTLGSVLKRPSWLPVPGFILKLGLGEMSALVLTGQRVLPCKALATGYVFKHKTLREALLSILN
jgi:uncharacterized protein